uniref:ZMYM2-like/QRICH1 C-terminal domain-containing protein n=1 Tax=Amphimedon queenslandica TaxID=400682 RepID=A0A1X7SKA1_AMPQE
MNEEKLLWGKGMLGEGSPHKLLKTMIFMCGIYFALRSGQEHRDLRFSQIKLKEIDEKNVSYTPRMYQKTSIKHQKLEPKT